MRVLNPAYTEPRPYTAAQKTALQAEVASWSTGKTGMTFDNLRAQLPALAGLTDGALHQLCADCGYAVKGDA
jgi:hypothetical protein